MLTLDANSLMFDDCCTLDASEDFKKRRDRLDTTDAAQAAVFAAEDEAERKRKRDAGEAPDTGANMEAAHAFVAPQPPQPPAPKPTAKKGKDQAPLAAMLDATPPPKKKAAS